VFAGQVPDTTPPGTLSYTPIQISPFDGIADDKQWNALTTTFVPDHSWVGIVRALQLSQREAQIAQLLLGEDLREDTIAAALAISPHTVHTHLERLYRKLGVNSRSQVVARMFQQYIELTAPQPERRDPASMPS
jgi:DNA-binding CsgD family transcriptional regulator